VAFSLAAVSATAFFHLARAQEKRWAAIDPNGEGSSAVVWGESENQARDRAIESCKKLSKTCANAPASTDTMNDVFALMCCTQPRAGCAVSVAGSREDALKKVQKTFADAGYSKCDLRQYISPSTGKKQ
jgi:hypothetical protein